jgi:hypothetical protein
MPIPVLLWNFSAWVWNWVWNLQHENWNTIPNIGIPFPQCMGTSNASQKKHRLSFSQSNVSGFASQVLFVLDWHALEELQICHATLPPLSPFRLRFELEISVQYCAEAELGCGVLGRTLISSFVTPCLPQQCNSRRNGGGRSLRCLSSGRGSPRNAEAKSLEKVWVHENLGF